MACQQSASSIAPEELIERSAAELQRLHSADLSVDVEINGLAGTQLSSATLDAEGSMQEGGKEIFLRGTLDSTTSEGPLRLTGDLFLRNGQETYIRIREVAVNPGIGFVTIDNASLQGFLNRWWLLPSSEPRPTVDSPADPSILPLQMRALDVTDDNEAVVQDGHPVREIDVALNRKRLLEFLQAVSEQRGENSADTSLLSSSKATGTVWIEEDTSLLKRVMWDIEEAGEAAGTMHIDLTLRNPNNGTAVTQPDSALPLVPGLSPVSLFLQNVGDATSSAQNQ